MKIPFLQLTIEVDKLYSKLFSTSDIKSINLHCEFIVSFINACGWTEDEYISHLFRQDSLILN